MVRYDSALAKFIDWSGLQIWWAVRLRSVHTWVANSKLEESLQFLNSPNFLPASSEAAQLQFDGSAHFRFPTPRPTDSVENNTVYGQLYRSAGRWQERPTIILLHGGGGDPDYHFRFPCVAQHFNRAGFNAVMIVVPYHFQRRAPGRAPWTHLQATEAFAQSVAEIRALTGWLLEQGCPAVALAGGSLGAYLAGLTACRDMRLASIVMAIPVARMGGLVPQAEQALGRRVREGIRRLRAAFVAFDKTPFNLTSARPAISKENVFSDFQFEPRHLGCYGAKSKINCLLSPAASVYWVHDE